MNFKLYCNFVQHFVSERSVYLDLFAYHKDNTPSWFITLK